MQKAIVIGASSGIGRELAKILSENNYQVGLVGRRRNLLKELQEELSGKSYLKSFDISILDQGRVKSIFKRIRNRWDRKYLK